MKRLTFAVLSITLFSFSGGSLLASYVKPTDKVYQSSFEQTITYGFYFFEKSEEAPTHKAPVYLCLDDQTNTLKCHPFDKKQSLRDFHQLIKTTLRRPAFTIEQVPKYYPYGEKWFAERTEDIAPRYNGQELDKESDFYYFNVRRYDPELARFVTPDVVVDGEDTTAGWNRYMYVKGNPIKYKDPTGHEVLDNISSSEKASGKFLEVGVENDSAQQSQVKFTNDPAKDIVGKGDKLKLIDGKDAKSIGAGRVLHINEKGAPGAGKMVEVDLGSNRKTRNLHLDSTSVKKGDFVNQGKKIGEVGNTGTRSTGPHLHLEFRENHGGISGKSGTAIDPNTRLQNPYK